MMLIMVTATGTTALPATHLTGSAPRIKEAKEARRALTAQLQQKGYTSGEYVINAEGGYVGVNIRGSWS